MSRSLLDPGQIAQTVLDEATGSIKVDVVASTGLAPGVEEDTAHSGSDTGSIPLAVRNDAATSLTATNGNYAPLSLDSNGNLRVAATFNEQATVADGGALPSVVKVVGGYDGAAVQVIKTDAAGELQIDVLSSALPSGAATSANQTNKSQYTRITDGTDDALVTAAGELNVLATAQPGVDIGDVTVNNAAGASAVNIQDGGNSLTVDAVNLDIRDLTSVSDSVSAVQSGTWNITNVSGTVSLPTGASTSAAQTDGSQKTQIVDGSGNVIGSTSNALDVNIKSGITLEVNLDAANDDVLVYGFDGAANQKIKTDVNGELQVDVLSSALPTGAATSANQTNKAQYTRITDGTDDALVTAAGELNVLATAQPGVDIGDVTINNPSLVVTATNLDIRDLTSVSDSVSAVQSGTWNINNVSGTISLPTGASTLAEQQTQTTSLQLLDDTVATTGAAITTKGIAAVGTDGTNARILKTDASGELQIDVLSSALPTGAATSANQTNKAQFTRITDGTDDALVTAAGELNVISTAQPGVDIGDVTINNASGGSAVNIQDGGNSITVDGTVAATQSGTWNINNISGTVSLPTGAATEATIAARLSGSFVPTGFDEVALTYVTVGNGIGQIETAIFKLATVTVKTLTLSYDGSNRLSGVVAS